eukprot:g43101.t1
MSTPTIVMDFISECMEDFIPKKSIRVFPNPFKSDDPGQYKKSRCDLLKAIGDDKRQYRTKLDAQTYQTDSRCLWQGLDEIAGYRMKQYKTADKATSLHDMLNAFYARFEQNASGVVMLTPTAPDTPVPSITVSEVSSVFLGVNPRKATGPDSVPSQALRSCVDQLAEVFTNIFNLFLLQAEVPTCFKKTIIIPGKNDFNMIKYDLARMGWEQILSGICAGPLLFVIYTNDLDENIEGMV